MSDESDIVRTLRIEEKLEKLNCNVQSNISDRHKFEGPPAENVSDESICFIDENDESPDDISAVEEIKDIEQSSFRSIKGILLFLDKSGRVIKVNDGAMAFSGLSEKEMIGKLFWGLHGAFNALNASNICEKFKTDVNLAESQIFSGELSDEIGGKRYLNFSAFPIKENDVLQYVIILGIDLTEQKHMEKKLRESALKFRSLAEYFEMISDTTIALGRKDLFSDVSDVIFQLSSDGRVTYINSAIGDVVGYMPEDVIGSSFSKIIPRKDWKTMRKQFFSKAYRNDMAEVEINSFETNIVHKDGHVVPVEINGKLIKQGVEVIGRKGQVRIQGSIRDITWRKRAEEERLKNAERLKQMNGELTAINEQLATTNEELKYTQDELEALNEGLEQKVEERTKEIKKLLKHKDEFIGQLGHDIKTPLTPLVALLPDMIEKEKDPELKKMLELSNRNVSFIRDLVVKTLEFERLGSPDAISAVDDMNLLEIVDDVLGVKQLIFEQNKINIQNNIEGKITVSVDELQIKELFDNIITNAVKFTPLDGSITLDACKDNDFVKVSICDTGIGMTSEQLGRIFDEFYKADPARHDLDSSGLGLPICKRIVEKHGGKIWAESPGGGKGTTFYFTLPLCSGSSKGWFKKKSLR